MQRVKTIPTTNRRNKKSRSIVRIAKLGSNDYSDDCRQNKQNQPQMTIPTTVVTIRIQSMHLTDLSEAESRLVLLRIQGVS
jgi:hypothetical protein